MVNKIEPKIYKINLLLLFALCIRFSSTLYAAQNDEVDDEKENIGQQAQQNDKQENVAVWSCIMCTFDNTIDNKKCAMCTTPHPLLIQHKAPKHNQNKLSKDSPINVKFMHYESKKGNNASVVSYRFKFMLNNSGCEISYTYEALYAIHQDMVKTHKVDIKQLVFPSENIFTYYFTYYLIQKTHTDYVNRGKQLQLYLTSLFSIYGKTKHKDILHLLGIWICERCKILNSKTKNKTCIKCKSEQITIKVFDTYPPKFEPFLISIPYGDDILLAHVLEKIIKYINNKKYEPHYIVCIREIGEAYVLTRKEIKSTANEQWEKLVNKKITTWDKDGIVKKGLKIDVNNSYHHSPEETKISCPYIKEEDTLQYSGLDLALQCPIYHAAKTHYKFSKEALLHLHFCSHFLDEYNEKPVCRHGAACKAFIRLADNGNLTKDLCHIKIYRHPPRTDRQIQLSENIHQYICTKNETDNKPLYKPTDSEKKNLLRLLLDEVIKHGYKYDLCLRCKQNNKCTHDVYQKNKNSLISIVEDKFNHPRYKKMGTPFHEDYRYDEGQANAFMLSLLLYTGGDCNYDLCKSQRNGDYNKWKIFDYCLWTAIDELSHKEYGSYKLYSGLNNTKLSKRNIKSGYFPTYTSTTVYRDIAEEFMGGQGMMIEIAPAVRNAFICCDVSWISKFPDEYEILVARTEKQGVMRIKNAFSVKILDDKKAVQTVLLTTNHADIIPKVASMIQGSFPVHQVTTDDVAIFKKLINGAKDIPADLQQNWNELRIKQEKIRFFILNIYEHYSLFVPLLFDPKCKNLLLIDKIAKLFPNATEIVCQRIDCIGTKYNGPGKYSCAIVNSKFIFGLKEKLGKIATHTKLTKIIIEISLNNKIKLDLDTAQFSELGWQIEKGKHVIVLTKTPYYDCICKVSYMIHGGFPLYEVTFLDAEIFNKLIARANDLPVDIKKIWDKFRKETQSITMHIRNMYSTYDLFRPIVFSSDPKCINLLLFDKIAKIFPNITEIICKYTDYDKNKASYSSIIVSSNFIFGLIEKLGKIDKHAKLTKIVIQTEKRFIKDSCKLYSTQFGALGWKIGKGCKTIFLTKHPYGNFDNFISKISAMVQESKPKHDEVTSLDVIILNQLIFGDKDIPSDVQKQWDEFRHQQQRITIHMGDMYRCYQVFMPLLIDINCKNLLLLDKIAQLFPNVTEIICRSSDCIEWDRDKTNTTGRQGELKYSSSTVCSNFILGVKACLSKMDKQVKLTKTVIQTEKIFIKDSCKLYSTQFGDLGWSIGKGVHGVVLIKNSYDLLYKDVISKISSMIQAKCPSYDVTSLDMPIFNKLILGGKYLPSDVQQIWDKFREKQTTIKVDIYYMYRSYTLFIPLFCSSDPKLKNLLLFDKIAQIFPNVTEIICEDTDCDGYDEDGNYLGYSSSIVSSRFMLGVKYWLGKIDKHTKLTKIVIKTFKHEIKDDCKLYATQLGALGWKIEKENKRLHWYDNKFRTEGTITLTKTSDTSK